MKKGFSYYKKVFQWKLKHYRPKHDVTFQTGNGLLSWSNKDWLMGKHLFVHRNYELDFIKNSMEFLKDEGLLEKGINQTVVDVGANIGMINIALLKENYFRKAIAFEPSPDNFRLLKKNVNQNNLTDKIRCYPSALSSENKDLELELSKGNSGDCRIRLSGKKGLKKEHRRGTVKVRARTFDGFLSENKEFKADEIDLLWMDIQGHEGHFFKGAKEFFKKRKIPCITEFWGYGIERAGMSQDEFAEIVRESFTGFYHLTGESSQLKPISEITKIFEGWENPRKVDNIILI